MVHELKVSKHDHVAWGKTLSLACQQWEDSVRNCLSNADDVHEKLSQQVLDLKHSSLRFDDASIDVVLPVVRRAMMSMEDLQQKMLSNELALQSKLDKATKKLAASLIGLGFSSNCSSGVMSADGSASLSRFLQVVDQVLAERKLWIDNKCNRRHGKVLSFMEQQEREVEAVLDNLNLE